MNEIMTLSWKIFCSQFTNHRHEINKEAPFQHHFAQVIRTVGELYSIGKDELFKVDLESKVEDLKAKGKHKYVDVTCEFSNGVKCAIELKFKLRRQGAQNSARLNIYQDIEALESAVKEKGFDVGKFYFITDDHTYVNSSNGQFGITFPLQDEHKSEPNTDFGGDVIEKTHAGNVTVHLIDSYSFNWEKSDACNYDFPNTNILTEWYFLELTISK